MTTSTRRGFLNAATTAVSGVVASSAAPPFLANAAACDVDVMAAEISAKLFADDGLARPIPESPTISDLAAGLDRTLVLGGGGDFYVAWYCGFFHGLYELGVDLNIAEMVVGMSLRTEFEVSCWTRAYERVTEDRLILPAQARPASP